MIISFLSQKGGVTKSTFARAVATAFASEQWSVHVVDLDWQQRTTGDWSELREKHKELNQIEVSVHRRINAGMKLSSSYDVLIVDGRPAADQDSLVIASKSDLVVIPTGTSFDDLKPQLTLANELRMNGISNLYFVVNKYPSESEAENTIRIIKEWGFDVSENAIPFKAGYSQANSIGLSIYETRFKSLNEISKKTIGDILKKAIKVSQHEK